MTAVGRRGGSDFSICTSDLLTAIPVHHLLLHVIGRFLQVVQRQRPVHDTVDPHAPEGLIVQLVALEADQFGDAKAERALEDARITDESQRLADGHVVTGGW